MSRLTGTWTLARLALRRDRVILPLWTVVIAIFPASVAGSFKSLYADPVELAKFAAQMQATPSITAMYGPIFGTTIGAVTAWRSGIILIIAALAAGLTVIRHTRNEEEQGRRELLGATVVGRAAPLASAFLVVGLASVLLGVLVAASMISATSQTTGSLAMGAEYTLVCWFFAAVAGLAAQLTQSARTARWIFGIVLGGSFTLRLLGDAGGELDNPLSWASPLGLTQRLRPYAGERWWVLGVVAALGLVVGLIGYRMTLERDLDAGLIAQRPGPARASRSLRSPLALNWRMQRGGMIGWLIGFALLGGLLGSAAVTAADAFKDNKQLTELFQRLGGGSGISDIFMGTLFAIMGIIAAAQGVQLAMRARTEETANRVEPLLATAVGRTRWLGGYLLLAFGGPAVTMAGAGLASGLSYGQAADDIGGQLPRMLEAALTPLPAIWLTTAIVIALHGLAPRLVGLGWGVLAAFLLLGQLGAVLRLSQWALDLSPFTHLPHLPGGSLTWAPLVWLTAIAAALTLAGVWGFRRRDIG